ncbi:MAG: hypothetical protein Q7T11_04640, partial [Deltaproteobacteria bacterium]|nr:hypothetical protein [Deltaproteobacteria bacterium]
AVKPRLFPPELEKYEKRGVDLTLLWENLKRTPTERVERHQGMAELVKEARRRKKNGPPKRSS